MTATDPKLCLIINSWTLSDQTHEDGTEWSLDEQLGAVKEAGFDAYSCPADTPALKPTLQKYGLRFGGAFDAQKVQQFEPLIRESLAIDNGPINCQLGDHDTPVEEAVDLTLALMAEAERQGAEVHLELHRDTCTETPEDLRHRRGIQARQGLLPADKFRLLPSRLPQAPRCRELYRTPL